MLTVDEKIQHAMQPLYDISKERTYVEEKFYTTVRTFKPEPFLAKQQKEFKPTTWCRKPGSNQ